MKHQIYQYSCVIRRNRFAVEIWVRDLMPHHTDVIMSSMASQITILTIVYSPFYSGADQRKHQSFASLAFVRGIHRWPVNSPHKGPVTRKMFPFDDVIMHVMYLVTVEETYIEGKQPKYTSNVMPKPRLNNKQSCNQMWLHCRWTVRKFT